MGISVRAKVELWITMDVDTDDLNDAYDEVEAAVNAEDPNIVWSNPEVTDVEYIGQTDAVSANADTCYEEHRSARLNRSA